MLALTATTTVGLLANARTLALALPAPARISPLRMQSEYEDYLNNRGVADVEATQVEYRKFKGIDQEFDGGDSGGGVVGDGNTDLEDQHNSATLGALRGGVADVTGVGGQVGRGNVLTLESLNDGDETKGVAGATTSRTSSAGANYFGRSTGIAEKLINEGFAEADVKDHRMDCVRAQQKENWFNQRAIHSQNRQRGQGIVFGESQDGKPREGGFNAQAALSATANAATSGGEVSQRDLANHMHDLAALPAQRLDGEEWGELRLTDADQITESFEVRSSPRQTHVTEIPVRNDYNTFAPFRCAFLPGSSNAFSVDPGHGSMNRRSGEPTEVVVRYTPQETGSVAEAMLVFETEDMKRIYSFVGST